MNQLPFSIFKKNDRRFLYVSFKNEQTGKYLPAISTKKETRAEAIKIAFEWLRYGIPSKNESINIKKYSLRDMAKEVDVNKADAEFICKELRRRGLLKTYVLEETERAINFSSYLKKFWDWEKSPYIKEKLRRNHALHKRYANEMKGAIVKYWMPFFEGKTLGEVTRYDIESFINYLETLPEQAKRKQEEIDITLQLKIQAESNSPKRKNTATSKRQIIRYPKSAKRKNTIIQAGTIALTWAFQKEIIDKDVTSGITWFSEKPKKRQILSREQAKYLFMVDWKDNRSKLANMLAMVTGMRAGEIQGLRVQDFGNDCLYVRHSWNIHDGLKTTKNNESRTVEVPFNGLMYELTEMAKSNPHGFNMESYVFWAEKLPNKPIEQDIFRRDLKDALIKLGLSKETVNEYNFHGWRHYFTAYMKPLVEEKILQSQTGHKTIKMLDHYADHRIAGDRERLRNAQIETFGGLVPLEFM